METIYGIISDVHTSDPLKVKSALNTLKKLGAQKLIFNGDLIGERYGFIPPQYYLQFVLKSAADTGLETYVQFGSHEEFLPSSEVLNHVSRLYGNIIDVSKQKRVEGTDHHLVFLPGSDYTAGGEYTFGSHIPTGTYIRQKKGLIPFESKEQLEILLQQQEVVGMARYENVLDFKDYIKDPARTIVVCHVPPKFKGNSNAVDVACFAEGKEGEIISLIDLKKMMEKRVGNLASDQLERVAGLHGYTVKRENSGSKDLASLYSQLSITKAINGHFHESAHRAHDHFGRGIPENTFTPELFWNASYIDGSKAGLLLVRDTLVSYRNINLEEPCS